MVKALTNVACQLHMIVGLCSTRHTICSVKVNECLIKHSVDCVPSDTEMGLKVSGLYPFQLLIHGL
jgi:hypothetical protein